MGRVSYNCIIVDDDEIDRLTVLSFLKDYSFLTPVGVFDTADKALAAAGMQKPDVLLLDVDMSGMNGLQLRNQLRDVAVCIFITSYPDYALDGFELQALDFLIKPITRDRFDNAMKRLHEYLILKEKALLLEHAIGGDTIFIKEAHTEIKLQLHEVLYLEAMKDYTAVVTASRKYMMATPMGTLLQEPLFRQFIRIHRSYAVPKNFVQRISANEVKVNDVLLPVGRTYKEALALLKK